MQKNHFLALIAIAIFTLSIASCKKEVIVTPAVVLTPSQLLVSGSWKLSAETEDGVDSYTKQSACEKDDFYTYTAAGKFTQDRGATKCDAADDQTITFDYTLTADGKIITFRLPGSDPFDAKVVELTATTLKTQITALGSVLVSTYSKK